MVGTRLYIAITALILLIAGIMSGKTWFRQHKWRVALLFLLALCIATVLCGIPFTNLFLQFETPEEAHWFVSTNDIIDVVEGESSAMIIETVRQDMLSCMIIPRDERGYLLAPALSTKTLTAYRSTGSEALWHLDIQKSTRSSDVYLLGMATLRDEICTLTDESGFPLDWYLMSVASPENEPFFMYAVYGCAQEPLQDTWHLILNGQPVVLTAS